MRERTYRTDAIIIRRSDIGEADRLLTIYSLQKGKIKITARGVRKTSSKLAGHLELFVHATMQLAKGRTFDVVTDSQVRDHFINLRTDLDRISLAYYVAELLDQLTPEEQDQPALYNLLYQTLTALDSLDDPIRRDVIMCYYELHMLILAGYRPHLFHCAHCEQPLTPDANRFSPHTGGVLCLNCADQAATSMPLELSIFKLLRFLARGTMEEALSLNVSEQLVREASVIIKTALRQVLERELKSAVFLNRLRS